MSATHTTDGHHTTTTTHAASADGNAADAPFLMFCTVDRCMLPVSRDFITTYLTNGVVPRLLGFTMEDGLTTPRASKNADGAYTIFRDLGICTSNLLHLMQWLRTGQLSEAFRQNAYETALRLGGLDVIDRAILVPPPPPVPPPVPPVPVPLPMHPSEDTTDAFQWRIANINVLADESMFSDYQWTVAGLVIEQNYHCYLRRRRRHDDDAEAGGHE